MILNLESETQEINLGTQNTGSMRDLSMILGNSVSYLLEWDYLHFTP